MRLKHSLIISTRMREGWVKGFLFLKAGDGSDCQERAGETLSIYVQNYYHAADSVRDVLGFGLRGEHFGGVD